MKTVYVYILDTLADWELGHVLAELNSRRFFKAGAPEVKLVHVGASLESVVSMGGISMTPDAIVDEIAVNEDSLCCFPVRTHGLNRSMLRLSPRLASSCRLGEPSLQSAAPPLPLRKPACWIPGGTPAMGKVFWRCSCRRTRGLHASKTFQRFPTAA